MEKGRQSQAESPAPPAAPPARTGSRSSHKGSEPGPPPLPRAALEADAERFLRLTEHAFDLIGEFDAEMRFVYLSPKSFELLGYAPDELVGKPAEPLIDPRDRERVVASFRDGIARGVDVRRLARFRRADGGLIWLDYSARSFHTQDGELRRVVVARDVTAQREALEELWLSEERLRTLTDHADELIAEVSVPDARLLYVSPSHERVLGYQPEELLGANVFDFMPSGPDEDSRRAFERLLLTERPTQLTFQFRHRDGSWRWVEGSGHFFETPSGEKRALIVGRDVTERQRSERERARYAQTLEAEVERRTRDLERVNRELKALQRRLIAAERLEAAGQLAGQIAHAINTPLSVLIGKLEMRIESPATPDPDDLQLLELSRRMGNVVDGMLNLSRRGELTITDVAPGDVLEDVRGELQELASSHKVELEVQAEPHSLHVDRDMLTVALVAIAQNAVQVSPQGSKVRLRAKVTARGRGVELSVADRGPGVPPELRERVFEPFFSTRPGGNGLGLPIAAGIIRGHGGRIQIKANRGGGALVRVDIPS